MRQPSPLTSLPTQQTPDTLRVLPDERGVTPRVVGLSLGLALFFGYFTPIIDFKLYNTFLGATHFPPGAMGSLLLLLLVVNPLLGRLTRRGRFSRNEALTVFITGLFSCLVSGHGSENLIIPSLLAPFYFANASNGWFEMLASHIPHWLTPALTAKGTLNASVVEAWYMGGAIPWNAWLLPLAFWSALALTSYAMWACLSVMLRKQWVEYEALAFPLLRLPLEMTQGLETGRESFWNNGLMWLGLGVAVCIQGMRGLNLYFPDVPTFPLSLDTAPLLREAPWNQIGVVYLEVFPVVVGIAYLLTSEVSFSLWFFYWFVKLQAIGLYNAGFPATTLPASSGAMSSVTSAIVAFQVVGCLGMFVATVLWTGREHGRYIVRRAFRWEEATTAERSEALSYPVAFWGFCGTFALLLGLTCLTGVRFDLALVLWGGYVLIGIGLTRVVAESGLMSVASGMLSLGIVARLFASQPNHWLSTQAGVVPASFVQTGFGLHPRAFLMPSFLHAFKLAHDRGIAAKPLLALISSVTIISFLMALYMSVRLGYDNGGLTLTNKWWAQSGGSLSPTQFLTAIQNASDNSVFWNWVAVVTGALITWGTMLLRARIAGFALHPIGYLMAHTYPVSKFWFSILLGWLAKTLISKYSSTKGYRATMPFFLGLALGDVAMMLFWLLIDGWQGHVNHALMPQ